MVCKDKSDRHDKAVIRSHGLAGFQEITLGRVSRNNHPTLRSATSPARAAKETIPENPYFCPPLPWSSEMSPSGSHNAPGFWGLFVVVLFGSVTRTHDMKEETTSSHHKELKFPPGDYTTTKKITPSSFHRIAAPFLGCLWRSDSQTNTESSIQGRKGEAELSAPISLVKGRAPLPRLI